MGKQNSPGTRERSRRRGRDAQMMQEAVRQALAEQPRVPWWRPTKWLARGLAFLLVTLVPLGFAYHADNVNVSVAEKYETRPGKILSTLFDVTNHGALPIRADVTMRLGCISSKRGYCESKPRLTSGSMPQVGEVQHLDLRLERNMPRTIDLPMFVADAASADIGVTVHFQVWGLPPKVTRTWRYRTQALPDGTLRWRSG